jgi:hypothetical protein
MSADADIFFKRAIKYLLLNGLCFFSLNVTGAVRFVIVQYDTGFAVVFIQGKLNSSFDHTNTSKRKKLKVFRFLHSKELLSFFTETLREQIHIYICLKG